MGTTVLRSQEDVEVRDYGFDEKIALKAREYAKGATSRCLRIVRHSNVQSPDKYSLGVYVLDGEFSPIPTKQLWLFLTYRMRSEIELFCTTYKLPRPPSRIIVRP